MDVQVRHALAHAIIDCHKGTLRAEPCFDGPRQQPRVRHQGRQQRLGRIGQSLHVELGNQERMAGKQGPVVEKGEAVFILEDRVHRAPGDQVAEATAHGFDCIKIPGRGKKYAVGWG